MPSLETLVDTDFWMTDITYYDKDEKLLAFVVDTTAPDDSSFPQHIAIHRDKGVKGFGDRDAADKWVEANE